MNSPSALSNQPHVAVIGAGCAGLSAAATLASQGIAVTVYDSAPHAGGRARTVEWNGLKLDNGQHILLGAYRETLNLLKLAGIKENDAFLRLPLTLHMADYLDLHATPSLPAPLHLLAGFLAAKGLSLKEKFYAIRMMLAFRRMHYQCADTLTVAQLLENQHQPLRLIKGLWEPLCLAALNTPIHLANAQVFLNVLRDSFNQSKQDSDLLLPKQDLSALLVKPLLDYIRQKSGQICLNTAILSLQQTQSGYQIVTTGDVCFYSDLVIAVSPFRLNALCASLPPLQNSVNMADALRYQPITTLYLQFPATTQLPKPMFGLVDTMSQWVFDRGQLYGQQGLLAVVISAQGAHQALNQVELTEIVLAELNQHFKDLGALTWSKVITEKRATFSCEAGVNRPPHSTPLRHVYLAGDYIAGDYPATIEGAIQSGVKCAHLLSDAYKINQVKQTKQIEPS